MTETVDVVLIGGGVMSATLGTLLQQLEPNWNIVVYERLSSVSEESSNAWNNAGTGHSALCELNYTPRRSDGSIDISKAVSINEKFQHSRELWSALVEKNVLGAPEEFINPVPHMTFVRGKKDAIFLRDRFAALHNHPLFAGMQYSHDSRVIHQWAPLLMKKRLKGEPFAATRVPQGSDVNFGALTEKLFTALRDRGATVITNHEVRTLKRNADKTWTVHYRNTVGRTPGRIRARFVFVGAGGWALKLLQRSGIPEISGYGVFPIGGQWLRTRNPKVVQQHHAKVYSQAPVGSPPMSVPHLDTRVINGEQWLLFGPFATFSPKFLKQGSSWDLVGQVRWNNVFSMLKVGATNMSLVKYLVSELIKGRHKKIDSLRNFMPSVDPDDWELLNAGQRAQVMTKGTLRFGTEVVTSSDGSLAGLLGASPGASTAVTTMIDLLKTCFPEQMPHWERTIAELVPSYGHDLGDDPERTRASMQRTAHILGLTQN